MPSIHPPCTPSASCAPLPCHPPRPPCKNPERCLKNTRKKKDKCASALSIMSTRASGSCSCSRTSKKSSKSSRSRSRSSSKSKKGVKAKGSVPSRINSQCCPGRGHRGRIKKKKKCCVIL